VKVTGARGEVRQPGRRLLIGTVLDGATLAGVRVDRHVMALPLPFATTNRERFMCTQNYAGDPPKRLTVIRDGNRRTARRAAVLPKAMRPESERRGPAT
jgi:hypothetical protein